jgi:hypothetical protein
MTPIGADMLSLCRDYAAIVCRNSFILRLNPVRMRVGVKPGQKVEFPGDAPIPHSAAVPVFRFGTFSRFSFLETMNDNQKT